LTDGRKYKIEFRSQEPGARRKPKGQKEIDNENFLITAYSTDAIKEGEHIWPR
jgi:hypothetical protein